MLRRVLASALHKRKRGRGWLLAARAPVRAEESNDDGSDNDGSCLDVHALVPNGGSNCLSLPSFERKHPCTPDSVACRGRAHAPTVRPQALD
jgi:hypothetical protein